MLRQRVFLLVAILGLTAFPSLLPRNAVAGADVTVYPNRVVLTNAARSAQIDVINTGNAQATYRISLVRKRMTENGEFLDVEKPEPEEKFADDLVKFSPRQVTLMPGASQTVRMLLKLPNDLEEGEYRSHLVFSKMPAGVSAVPKKDDEVKSVSMSFTINVGVSIPVIVRHGRLDAAAEIDLSSVKVVAVEGKEQQLAFTLNRSGTRSIYGDATVYRGDEKVAEAKGLAVYTPNRKRQIGLPIPEHAAVRSGDTLKVVFKERESVRPLAAATAVVP